MKRPAIAAALMLCVYVVGTPATAASLEPFSQDAPVPELTLEGLDGKPHSLSDYRGKVVLLNFWASWCLPCMREMPGMQRLADTLADRPFEILAINVAEAPKRVEASRKRMKIDFTVLLDPDNAAFHDWKVRVLPTSFLLDLDGRIRYQVVGPMEWDTAETVETIESMLPDQK